MPTDVKVDLGGLRRKIGSLRPGGRGRRFLASEILRVSDPFVPFRSGTLKNSGTAAPDGSYLMWSTPYARYQWGGKLYVDPKYGIGAFHDRISGRFWSRPGVQKVQTDRNLVYKRGPYRGPRWVQRAWDARGKDVIAAVQRYIFMQGD